MPPQATDMPPQATDVPPQATDVPPQATDMPPQATDLPSQATDVAPQATDLPPQTTDLLTQGVGLPVQAVGVASQDVGMASQPIAPAPQGSGLPAQPVGVHPQAAAVLAQCIAQTCRGLFCRAGPIDQCDPAHESRLVSKPRKAMVVVALFVLVSTALVLPLLYPPKGSGVVATSIEVLGYTTNKQGELCARVSLKNSGTATISYGAGCFSGGAPPIKGEAETERGRIAFDGPHGGSGGPCWVLPGSNRVFSVPLPDTTSRWQITYEIGPATSPRERVFIALIESGWWNRLHPASQTFVKLIPHVEAQRVLTQGALFAVPEAARTRRTP